MSVFDSELELSAAAWHEAGHAVVAHLAGHTFRGLAMEYFPKRNRWGGRLVLPHSEGRGPDGVARAAIAGMLAEAKARAMHRRGESLAFLPHDPLDDLLTFLTSKHSEASPGSFSISFGRTRNGERLVEDFSGELYSLSDHNTFQAAIHRSLNPIEVVVATMTLLDEPRNWNAVIAVAKALVSERPDGATIQWRIQGRDVIAVIQSQLNASV